MISLPPFSRWPLQGAVILSVLSFERSAADEKKEGFMVMSFNCWHHEALVASIRPLLAAADETPVVLTGDFNVPSHLDWTVATAAEHGGTGPVAWPESLHLAQAGLVDSFRLKHPDPAAEAGTTWSAIHKADEPQDRIDFIYHKGAGLRVTTSRTFSTAVETTVGAWGVDTASVSGNTWPSDHAAVLTSYAWAPAE